MSHTPPVTADDLMRLIDRYAAHLAVAGGYAATDHDRAMEREQRLAVELRDRIRAEVDRLYAPEATA